MMTGNPRRCSFWGTQFGARARSIQYSEGVHDMANTPKRAKDPTEVALSAIQEALNISDAPAESRADAPAPDADQRELNALTGRNEAASRSENTRNTFGFDDGGFQRQDHRQDQRHDEGREEPQRRSDQSYDPRPANDDRETIG